MKYAFISLSFLIAGIITFSCNKREIIPAPEPKVDLKNYFYGRINGAEVELTQNVNGYSGTSGVDLIINATSTDSAVYHSTFSSDQSPLSISVGHGSLIFDWTSGNERPSLSIFESFYLASINQTPLFSTNGLSGFTVTLKDGSGKEWKSNQNHSYAGEDVLYNQMEIESDASGDYAKFKVAFDTYVYNTYFDNVLLINVTDSILITDAVYTGWYQR